MSMYTDAMKAKGTADALDLRERAAGMDGTAIIAEEQKAPAFDGTKDYSAWPVGAPVQHEGQVYKLLQPHNAANYEGSHLPCPPCGVSRIPKTPQRQSLIWHLPAQAECT